MEPIINFLIQPVDPADLLHNLLLVDVAFVGCVGHIELLLLLEIFGLASFVGLLKSFMMIRIVYVLSIESLVLVINL